MTDPTDLDTAIREVITASYTMFADHAIDEAIEQLYRERAAQLKATDQ